MSNINVIGLGYVGLPTAVMFASNGHNVRGVDSNLSVVTAIQRGTPDNNEPHLNELLQKVLQNGQFTVSTSASTANVFVIAVPTPIGSNRKPKLDAVSEACQTIAEHITKGDLVIVESTVAPGTIRNEITLTLEQSGLAAGNDFSLAYCPERVLPGNVFKEIVENDRIIGGIDDKSTQQAVALYRSFVTGELYETDAETAEVAKLAENTYRDVNIALANSLANLSETVGVDIWSVLEMANRHPRVNLHTPGAGVGGHCIPVDPWFLISADPESSALIEASREINDGQPGIVARMAADAIHEVKDGRVAILGAAYKPNVTDARESPTTKLIARLIEHDLSVAVSDPYVTNFIPKIVSLDAALCEADIVILVVGHSEYSHLEPGRFAKLMRGRVILDITTTLNRAVWEKSGFTFLRYGDGQSKR
ncbi:MAG: nucleotide sugar dehydrogenase [Dehalococcoidia bacterium]